MERVRALINKLQEQFDQGADSQALMVTVQMLQAELQSSPHAAPARAGSAKVAVVMPSGPRVPDITSSHAPELRSEALPEEAPVAAAAAHELPTNNHQPQTSEATSDWLHSLMQEIPTLAHQKDLRELNEVISQQNGASLNDKLKQSSTELAEVLTREPVRDLKKAIGINDRFVFVNELFRGDEVMYERSIKTINSFNILQEAEFWMERELKLKLAWDESKDTVRHFCQLVRRRFSSM
ncbi:hypothetical protein ACFSQD_07755 [Flavihumibacter stibioxidans]|uniref:Uncharacterized protein n=1 Tax=Flavihumibacter stibioxidans TaxID=1834163 RepID=A0ABR7M5B3_9BACT|nr:hypothetical protein [Flavihumibacter stibioxidans]MBC6490201.1 hypothetical protein [Flavihumibacter stibioxidans]